MYIHKLCMYIYVHYDLLHRSQVFTKWEMGYIIRRLGHRLKPLFKECLKKSMYTIFRMQLVHMCRGCERN
jgi:hypothetical protein